MRRGLLVVLAACLLAPAAKAGGPSLQIGVLEDEIRKPTLTGAKAGMTLARLLGLDSVRVTALWTPGLTAPTGVELNVLQNVAAAAGLTGMRVYVAVHHPGSRTTPLTDEDRSEFARYTAALARAVPPFRRVIVGNEPNLNRFWLPQFNPDGSDAAAPAYLALLAKTYDALKAVSPRITVIGGALAARGADNPAVDRHTHSPTTFIRDLGAAYRASGRTAPIMDQFSIHPYQDNSSQPPTFRHPNTKTITISDYPKLVALLGTAFDGTAQPGSAMPIVYGEYGVEAQIPARKVRLYTGIEPFTTKPVPEATQAAYYRQAIGIAFCQPTVKAIILLHMIDEVDRNRWQSGMYRVDRTPRASAAAVRRSAQETDRGVVARCPDLALPVRVATRFPARDELQRANRLSFRIHCNLDCAFTAHVERLPRRATVATTRGRAIGRKQVRVTFPPQRLKPGQYRIAVSVAAALNPGPQNFRASVPFRIVKPAREPGRSPG
jgi:hypothetical protein